MRSMTILEEAAEITTGERNADYGPPEKNHASTAYYWRGWIRDKYGVEIPFDIDDVCMMDSLQKISRQAHKRKRDNLVDICGYLRNIEMAEFALKYVKNLNKIVVVDCPVGTDEADAE